MVFNKDTLVPITMNKVKMNNDIKRILELFVYRIPKTQPLFFITIQLQNCIWLQWEIWLIGFAKSSVYNL